MRFCAVSVLFALFCLHAEARAPFQFHDGDRVVLLGDTLIEREQLSGYLEERLTIEFPERNVIFRNLGWSADTPEGISRASFDFDKPGKGFEKLTNQVASVQPSVVILGYGMASSLEDQKGASGVEKFKTQMNLLMDATQGVVTNKTVRFIVLSPIRHEDLGPPLPDPKEHNRILAKYVEALREIARERRCEFVSLFDLSKGMASDRKRPLTENGIHPTDLGYARIAEAVAEQLGWKANTGHRGPEFEELRRAIIKKNELYFDRWRPQNETYLFGFRKYEQGQNAKEIPMFDPLVVEQEKRIAELRRLKKVEDGAARAAGGKPLKGLEEFKVEQSNKVNAPKPEFEVAPGFEVNLFAESPLLAKPIQMNFDPQGRLWIASSSVYPQIQPGQTADDKILILEDTDGDGYAEKSTVFADGLLIPTSVIPGDGGAYVGQSTELLHFKDTNGDGKADEKHVVLSGFGTEDTHHMVHTLRWGPDGQLYFNQSIYIHSHFETPHGVERLNSGGIWHLRPNTLELGVFVKGFCNPWGHDWDAFGQSFITDGAGFQGISYGVPGATYFTYADMRRELKSISPGNYPKFCGLELIRSQQFPDDWQGNAITCDFRAHRVVRFGIEEDGSGFAAHEITDLLRTTNVTFRPIDVKLGPDGALYVADWSNPIIQHGEVDFRDPRRDHEHGRIWRVTAKGRPLVPKPALLNASNVQLFEQLLSPNAFNQQQAKRVLAERGKKVEKDLARWTRSLTSEKELLEALWMYQAIDVVEPKLLERVLDAKDPHLRAAGTRVLNCWHSRLKNPMVLLEARVRDVHPRVKLEAMRALAEIPSARSAELVLSVVDKPMDTFLEYAAWLSINDLAQPWVAAVKEGKWKPEGREKELEFALKALEPQLAGVVLAQVMERKQIPKDGSGPWIELIGSAGNEALLQRLFGQVLADGFDKGAMERALKALGTPAKQRDAKPPGNLEAISVLLENTDPKIREQVVHLIGDWKLKKFVPDLAGMAEKTTTPGGTRKAAFEALREIGGKEVVSALQGLSGKEKFLAVRKEAVVALAGVDVEKASKPAVEILLSLKDEKQVTEFWREILGIKDAGNALGKTLPKTGLPVPVAKAGLKVAREGGRREPDLVWALTRGADLEEESEALSEAELRSLAKTATSEGDATRGERVFRRKDLACTSCHAIGGVGGKVGPDLTSIGASAQMDYLIESVLYPNRKIKEGYHAIIVETKDGMDVSGVLVKENTEELVLRDATGKEVTIAKNNIANRATGKSLMPNGVVDVLTANERLDLYKFLSELGKPGPFDAAKANVARAWKLLPETIEIAQFGDEKALKLDSTDKLWTPAHSLVDGRLLKQEFSGALEGTETRGPQAIYAAAEFQVAKAGQVGLKLSGADGAMAWVDGKAVKFSSETKTDLQPGKHRLIVKLETKKLPEAIRLESEDATFLAE